ncbi:hypothetical protein CVT24_002026 [Panaeolus cyanescens]|uniref:ACB domain-containing protein n=1 Tax=Panaeolus cyanescens TaxID=181874 RepID=A0A409YHH7_9AGAR|nr:hypothetical protein CVT24_002026 [Panaeolus cyanescens]
MASRELIDAQFDRAVEIVQSLPKTGPIQTDYEEKLTMYSLFKQATAGNVKSPRPGMWDMLGRAKWDAWAKHRDLDSYEAKWLYVEALLKVLRRYSDKTVAQDLVEELESYSGDPSNIVMSRTLSKSPGSDASGSTVSEPDTPYAHTRDSHLTRPTIADETSSSGDSEQEEANELPAIASSRVSTENRPQSSLSSNRYRTPLAGSLAMSPPPLQQRLPSQQPLPGFETPSAFGEAIPHQFSHGQSFADPRGDMVSPPHLYPGHPSYHTPQPYTVRPPSAMALERAVESVQAHLAALTERLETLESRSFTLSRSNLANSPRKSGHSPNWGRGSPNHAIDGPYWDLDDMGMWSMVLNPMSRGLEKMKEWATFFARNENRSPSMIIIRRLCLDVSFLVCVVAVLGALWRKSGVRRREVKAALVILWRAIVGHKSQASLVERGI